MYNFAMSIFASTLFTSSSLYASGITSESSQCDNYDVYIMRHLPKVKSTEHKAGNKDPELNEIGQKMALALANTDFMAKVDVGFSTNYQRTKQTLEPSAKRHDFDVHIYEPRNNQSLTDTINTQYCRKTIAIVGHSNTTPAIVKALGGTFEVTFAGKPLPADTQVQLDESDYGAVFHIKKEQGVIEQDIFRLKP